MARGSATCSQCATTFTYDVAGDAPPPPTCGQLQCRAKENWSTEDWAGQARMARARLAAGIELNQLDHDALALDGQA